MADFGTYRGAGEWGVSTLVVNPLTEEPHVTLFATEAEAIDYARDRAQQTGAPERGPSSIPDRSVHGRIYYVLHYAPGEYDSAGQPRGDLRYRVLRGMRGGARKDHEQVLVFKLLGNLPNGKQRWDMITGLSVDIPDLEEERELAKRARGTQRLSREDAGKDPRGHKQSHIRQGRGPKFGPAAAEPTRQSAFPQRREQRSQAVVEYRRALEREAALTRSQTAEAAQIRAARLREHIADLEALLARLQRVAPDRLNRHRISLVEEKLDASVRELEALGA